MGSVRLKNLYNDFLFLFTESGSKDNMVVIYIVIGVVCPFVVIIIVVIIIYKFKR